MQIPTDLSVDLPASKEETDLSLHLLKKTIIYGLLSLFFFLLTLAMILLDLNEKSFTKRIAGEVLRFHVIANSDSPKDQAAKLVVRDALIAYMSAHREDFSTREEALSFVENHLPEFEEEAKQVLTSLQLSYEVRSSLSVSFFPKKTYGDLSFPPGLYEALRVELGEAKGKNWWCVLYPLLCFTEEGVVSVPEESEKQLLKAVSKEDYDRLHPSSPRFSWKILEWLQGKKKR